jgi:cytochrome c-type biogenesis protein
MGRVLADVSRAVSDGSWWAPAVAFAAGLVSFASPCVLPLVPGYLLMVTGEEAAVAGDPRSGDKRWAGLLPVGLFILGFSIVFTLLGGFAGTALSSWLRSDAGQRAAGVFVIGFGLFMLLYAFQARLPWLYREERPLLGRVRPGPAGALPLGMAFAVGWTPCIGPVLGAILTLAAAQQSAARASLLLFVYSLGLGIPFLLIGAGVTKLLGALRFFSRHYRGFAAVSGLLLVTMGVLLVSGLWTQLLSPVLNAVNRYTPPI